MKLPRRQFLHLTAGAAALPAVSRIARAQTYPTRPVRIVVGYVAGGTVDVVARLMAQWLSERLGQSFIVENRPGAGSNVGTEVVVRAPPDGYTLLMVSPANAINTTLYDKLTFSFLHDVAPVAGVIRVPLVLVANLLIEARTVSEFISYAKANPGKISMASYGIGTTSHVAGELFKTMAGVNMVHVPYRGEAAALTDLLGGQVQVFFGSSGTIEHIRAGRLRPLAVTTDARLDVLPSTPTVGEFLPGYEASGWQGVGAPRNTPVEIIQKLNSEINAALADPRMAARLSDLGGTVLGGSSADFGKLVSNETERWGKVIRAANIKPE